MTLRFSSMLLTVYTINTVIMGVQVCVMYTHYHVIATLTSSNDSIEAALQLWE